MTVQPANTIWRDFVTDGVPASGQWAPHKADIRAWGTSLEGPRTKSYATRTALRAATPVANDAAVLCESGRSGVFVFSASNLSSLVSADTQEGLYIAPTSDTTGASGAWVRQRDSLDVFVKWFGALGDGTTDDITPINKAILALPVIGGRVIFDALTYRTSGPIIIGDGTSSTFSTRYGVSLVGANVPIDPPVWSAYPQATGTKIKIDNVTGAIVDVRGPLRGWGVSNMVLQGNALTNYGIKAMSAGFGRVENVSIYSCQSDGVHLNCYSTASFAPTTQNVNTERVHFQNVFIFNGGSSGCAGVRLAGASDGTSSTCFCSFDTLDIVMGTASVQQYGVYLAVADTNIFTNAHIYGTSHATSVAVVADYSFNATFPSANYFFGLDPALQGGLAFATNGTPGPNSKLNRVYGCSDLNGPTILSLGFAADMQVSRTSLASDFAGQNVATAQPVFAPAQDTFNLKAGTLYRFKGLYIIARGAGTTSHTTSLLWGGTATFTSFDALAKVSNGDAGTLGAVVDKEITVATGTVVTAANTSATESVKVMIEGEMRVNAAGTFIPQFQYSAAPGGAPAIRRGSFFEIWPIGPAAFTSNGEAT
ncbi:hypothetical protein [Mesorhizobium sp.]|uniref:hypothetical protein n=1 Tax=Mesorhizobium sp. TaxID=1871066 RepID=UPI000FE54BE8|nr:hypothetical protein [Mesorhizobium sp.]RWM26885.1 MAG: hypothetical protein EOR74_13850 [Mesorhizobium sp.]